MGLREPARAALIALLAACSPPPPPAAPPPVVAPAPPPPSAPAGPLRLVVQPLTLAHDTLDPLMAWALVPSPDGLLLAAFGPELRLVDTATGEVRARLLDGAGAPRCASGASFSPDGAVVAVLGCPDAPGDDEWYGGRSSEVSVLLWSLSGDTTRPLASGRFSKVSFSDDGRTLHLSGSEGAQAIEIATGTPLPPPEPEPRLPDRPESLASPDRRILAWMDGTTLVVEEGASGAEILRRPFGPDCRPHAWTRKGDLLAVRCTTGAPGRIDVLGVSGETQCSVPTAGLPPKAHLGHLIFSRDGGRFVVDVGRDRENRGIAIHRARDCARERFEPEASVSRYLFWSDDLVGFYPSRVIGSYFGSIGVIPRDPREPRRTIGERLGFTFARAPGDRLRAEHAIDLGRGRDVVQVFDPRTETVKLLLPEDDQEDPITTVSGVLHAIAPDGKAVVVRGSAPPGDGGTLALIDASDRRLPLARSEAYGHRENADTWYLSRFWVSPRGAFVAALGEEDQQRTIALWDARTGRRIASHAGGAAAFSADETRAAVLDLHMGATVRILDPRSGRTVADSAFPQDDRDDPVAAWSRRGALLAVRGLGVHDGASGKRLWAHAGDFPPEPWSPRGDRVATIGSTHTPLGWGPIEIREARTGKLAGSVTGRLEGWSRDGALFLARVPGSFHEVRDATTLEVRARVGPARSAALSEDGRFVFHQGGDAIRVLRLADGAELYQVVPDEERQRGLSYTASGLFDGGPEALRWIRFRVGRDVAKGRLIGLEAAGGAGGRRPGLAADFFAGKPLDPPALAP